MFVFPILGYRERYERYASHVRTAGIFVEEQREKEYQWKHQELETVF